MTEHGEPDAGIALVKNSAMTAGTDEVLFTIAIPFRNPGEYFDLAVRSVFAQTYTDWELLLIDDGSSDGSVDWARRITDPRVRLVVDGHHRNLSGRLNQAAGMARGRFLVRMDADDVMHPRRLELLLPVLQQSDARTVVGSWAYTIDLESKPVGIRRGSKRDDGWHARLRFIHPTVAGHAVWFRENLYSEEQVFARGEDAELWIRTRAVTHREIVSVPLLYYREVGVHRHHAYMGTARALREIIDRMGGPWWFARRLRLTFTKLVMTLSHHLGIADFWIRRRSERLSPTEAAIAWSDFALVKQAKIPGVD